MKTKWAKDQLDGSKARWFAPVGGNHLGRFAIRGESEGKLAIHFDPDDFYLTQQQADLILEWPESQRSDIKFYFAG